MVGCSGAGKTTVARVLAERLGVPHVELDAIFHQPGWQELPTEEFRARVREATAAEGWVVDGNYSKVSDIVRARADTMIWIDLDRPVVMRAVIGRTLRRVVRREELWNGNREPWTNLTTFDPTRSIIAWSWTRHGTYRERLEAAMADPELAHLRWVRLRSRREIAQFLEAVPHA